MLQTTRRAPLFNLLSLLSWLLLVQCGPDAVAIAPTILVEPTAALQEITATAIPSIPPIQFSTATPIQRAAPVIPTLTNVEIIATRPRIATIAPQPSATPIPPTVTPIPSLTPLRLPACSIPVDRRFLSMWSDPTIYAPLGCPRNQGHTAQSAEEMFEGGSMLWRQDTDQIYAIFNSGAWEDFTDTFVENDPEYSCSTPSSPPSPRRGFSKVWCANSRVRSILGNALERERGFCMAGGGQCEVFQDFSGGFMFYSERFGRAYALLNDGTWQR